MFINFQLLFISTCWVVVRHFLFTFITSTQWPHKTLMMSLKTFLFNIRWWVGSPCRHHRTSSFYVCKVVVQGMKQKSFYDRIKEIHATSWTLYKNGTTTLDFFLKWANIWLTQLPIFWRSYIVFDGNRNNI